VVLPRLGASRAAERLAAPSEGRPVVQLLVLLSEIRQALESPEETALL